MAKILLAILLTGLLSATFSCGTLHSVTQIENERSFVLGQGNHGPYKATVQNIGDHTVDVIIEKTGSNEPTPFGTLKPGEKADYKVNSNTKVSFKNRDTGLAKLKFKVKGGNNLFMGYQ